MSKRKKVLIFAVSLCLIAAISVVGTIAYLTDRAAVVNVFTFGNVEIDMTELAVDPEGNPVGDQDGDGHPDRNYGNEYHLVPGLTYPKDPTIFVDANSEDSWLFVKIENDIAGLEEKTDTSKTIAAQMAEKGWTLIDETNSIYAYREIVEGGESVVVFDSFTIDGNADFDTAAEDADITVTAYAIQAATFETAEEAWTTVDGNF